MKSDDGMTCEEARRLLYDIIDREASEIDARAVQDHLTRCRECYDIFHLEETIQDFICAKLRNSGSPSRIQQLRDRVLMALDSIDKGEAA